MDAMRKNAFVSLFCFYRHLLLRQLIDEIVIDRCNLNNFVDIENGHLVSRNLKSMNFQEIFKDPFETIILDTFYSQTIYNQAKMERYAIFPNGDFCLLTK